MRLLVAASKVDFPHLPEVVAEAKRLLPDERVAVVSPSSINWQTVIQTEGSWEGAYRWAARRHDACLVVETAEGALGRGVFEIAQQFLRLGKRVVVVKNGRLVPVTAVAETGVGDWKTNYGAVQV